MAFLPKSNIPRVLVTGGRGMVGRAIKEIAPKSGYKFYFSTRDDGDLSKMRDVEILFNKIRPHYVIHLAARVGGLFRNINESVEMFEENIDINKNVVKCCHDFGVYRSVHCLSTCVFPDNIEYPIGENVLHNGPPHTSNQGYAYAKRMLEVQTRLYNDRYIREGSDKRMICVIPTNVYGPHDNFNLEDGHVIPALIHKCFDAVTKGENFIVRGSGKPLRQFIHSSDLANVMLWLLLEFRGDLQSIIVAPDEKDEISIGKVAELIKQSFEEKYDTQICMKFTHDNDGQFKKTADNSKLKTYLSTFEFKKFEEGINECVEWFIENYNTLRK